MFGAAATAGDLNADGCDEAIVGLPSGGLNQRGLALVYKGDPDGLQPFSFDDQVNSQIALAGRDKLQVGAALATGYLNDDEFADLVVGAPNAALADNETIVDPGGEVYVIFGSTRWGLDNIEQAIKLDQDILSAGGQKEQADKFGSALFVANFDSENFDDIAVGVPGETLFDNLSNEVKSAGVVQVFVSSPELSGLGDFIIHQGLDAIVGAPEQGDRFGTAVAAGQFDASSGIDLVVDIPSEAIGTGRLAGGVQILYDTDQGDNAAKHEFWGQDSFGLSQGTEELDRFGSVIGIGNFNGDSFADLAIGTPNEALGIKQNADLVTILYGLQSGLTSFQSQTLNSATPGLKSAIDTNAFGAALSTASKVIVRDDVKKCGALCRLFGGQERRGATQSSQQK
ncbi:MAG: FG-GAP repeat protein [Pseudomonadota bacterium]